MQIKQSLDVLLLLSLVNSYVYETVLGKLEIELLDAGISYYDSEQHCLAKNLTLLSSEFNRTSLQASLAEQKLSIHGLNFWSNGRCSWKSKVSGRSIAFNKAMNEIPEYLALEAHNDGTKNCLAIVCNYGCNLTDHNCDERLSRTCSNQLRVPHRRKKRECKNSFYIKRLSISCFPYLYVCSSEKTFSWNQTPDYDCNLTSEAEIDNTIYVLKQLHDRDWYTPILPKEDHNMYYWIGDIHYTCDTGETLPRDFNIDNNDCYNHAVRTEESKPGGITIQDPKASNCASRTAKLVICVDNSTDTDIIPVVPAQQKPSADAYDDRNLAPVIIIIVALGGVVIICIGLFRYWKKRRRLPGYEPINSAVTQVPHSSDHSKSEEFSSISNLMDVELLFNLMDPIKKQFNISNEFMSPKMGR